jgi:two-component system, NtrC family, sensor histidine kinase PilS
MRDSIPVQESWLGPLEPSTGVLPLAEELASVRLWRAFMTTRIMVALVVVLLQTWFMVQNHLLSWWPLALCLAYLAQTLAVRFLARPKLPGRAFESQWSFTIGIDVLMFSGLQFLQLGGINYTPLFALPLLLASVLGSISLALGTAAAITLLLLGEAWWLTLTAQTDSAARFLQVGLSGIGFFVLSFLTYQVATRLARQEQLTRSNQQAARVQTEVNELVIENLQGGVLVIDEQGVVRAANPAAQRLLGGASPALALPFQLAAEPAWLALAELAQRTLVSGQPQQGELMIGLLGHSTCRVRASTRQTANTSSGQAPLCVMFLEDLREIEARLRTEKLAAMGRMSAAVAHEIRNPLAAIAQANELLDEDLTERSHKQLTLMVRQNAQRLDQIVEDILNISRVQHQGAPSQPSTLPLGDELRRICRDWALQNGGTHLLRSSVQLHFEDAGEPDEVVFEQAHLRRVLVNLLDNAWRYASRQSASIQISSAPAQNGRWLLQIWSDSAPLEWSVQRHLFEPFFSSESRSSGLGLYICRELCERHAASIGYQRSARGAAEAAAQDGNEFFIFFQRSAPGTASVTAPLFAHV